MPPPTPRKRRLICHTELLSNMNADRRAFGCFLVAWTVGWSHSYLQDFAPRDFTGVENKTGRPSAALLLTTSIYQQPYFTGFNSVS